MMVSTKGNKVAFAVLSTRRKGADMVNLCAQCFAATGDHAI